MPATRPRSACSRTTPTPPPSSAAKPYTTARKMWSAIRSNIALASVPARYAWIALPATVSRCRTVSWCSDASCATRFCRMALPPLPSSLSDTRLEIRLRLPTQFQPATHTGADELVAVTHEVQSPLEITVRYRQRHQGSPAKGIAQGDG